MLNRSPGSHPYTRRRGQGFTLTEVLVTVVVLSVGLLGLAGLQFRGLKFNQSAYMRSQATIIAYDLIDRMRTNASNLSDYEVPLDTAPSGQTGCQAASASCSPAQMAEFDINQWKCSLGKWDSNTTCDTLGITGVLNDTADGSVTRSGSVYTVTVRWTDRNGETVSLAIPTEF